MEEINLNNNNINQATTKKKSKLFIILGVIAIIFIIIAIASSCGSNGENLEIISSNMSVEYNEYYGYSVSITGVAKNNTGNDLSYAQVEFSLYDSAGNNLGTAIANVNNIEADGTWRFEATYIGFLDIQPTSYKLADTSAW